MGSGPGPAGSGDGTGVKHGLLAAPESAEPNRLGRRSPVVIAERSAIFMGAEAPDEVPIDECTNRSAEPPVAHLALNVCYLNLCHPTN